MCTCATHREDLSEQHAIAQEIADVLTQRNAVGAVDEDELDEELAQLQQEELDNKMLKTGTIPVHDQVQRLPAVGTGPREFFFLPPLPPFHGLCPRSRSSTLLSFHSSAALLRPVCPDFSQAHVC